MADGPERGLELIERIDLPGYHLLHAARADLLRRLDRRAEAAAAYREALALEMNAADRAFLESGSPRWYVRDVYRERLPQLDGGVFLTDGGIETTLIFHRGLDLPEFAAFHLLQDEAGPRSCGATTRRTRSWRASTGSGSCSRARRGGPTRSGRRSSATRRRSSTRSTARRSR